MTRKTSAMMRPRRGKLVAASSVCPPDPSATLGLSVTANSKTVRGSPSKTRRLSLPQHGRSLLQFLNEDRTRQRFCDVSVSVGGNVYSAHKVVLAHGSSYFHAELSKSSAATAHVTLDHVEGSVFQHLLGFLYTAECVVADADLPALAEAARFLDMMDVLKLMCEEGCASPFGVTHAQTELRGHPRSDSAHIQSPEDKSPLFNHQVSVEASRRRSVAEDTEVRQGGSASQRSAVTRRSARSRRTPTKYRRDDVKHSVAAPVEQQRAASPRKDAGDGAGEAGGEVVGNQTLRPDVSDIPKPDPRDDAVDEDGEEDEQVDANAGDAAHQRVVEVGEEGSRGGRTEQQPGEVRAPAAGSSNKTQVYPEGLAPIIIQTSSKKILKCPKCDKTFDRAGEGR